MDLRVDANAGERLGDYRTGIFVRAKGLDGRWGNVDIAVLERDSLLTWLRRLDATLGEPKSGESAERVVLLLLGHE